jgi:hypothetical protein
MVYACVPNVLREGGCGSVCFGSPFMATRY